MKEGDIVLASFPQADGRMKNRPALVLREIPPFNDLLVCGISTQLRHCVGGFDETISAGDSDFQRPLAEFGDPTRLSPDAAAR